MKRAVCWIVGILFLLIFLLPLVASLPWLWALMTCLPLGWWHFLQRTLPQMSLNWSLIGMGLLCSAAILLLVNRLLVAFFPVAKNSTEQVQCVRSLHLRWPLAFYAGIWLTFASSF